MDFFHFILVFIDLAQQPTHPPSSREQPQWKPPAQHPPTSRERFHAPVPAAPLPKWKQPSQWKSKWFSQYFM